MLQVRPQPVKERVFDSGGEQIHEQVEQVQAKSSLFRQCIPSMREWGRVPEVSSCVGQVGCLTAGAKESAGLTRSREEYSGKRVMSSLVLKMVCLGTVLAQGL